MRVAWGGGDDRRRALLTTVESPASPSLLRRLREESRPLVMQYRDGYIAKMDAGDLAITADIPLATALVDRGTVA